MSGPAGSSAARCVGVGCNRPARKADLDHTLDHAKGGKTTFKSGGKQHAQ